jgi:hypothetical protein
MEDITVSPTTQEVTRQRERIRAKIISCNCAVMETPNINRTSRVALLQQCLAELDMNIRDLEAEPKERDSLVTNRAKFHEIGRPSQGRK